MGILSFVALLIATTLVARALQPKIKSPSVSLDDFNVPTAEAGRPIPWVFGTCDVKGPNCIWYGDLMRKRHKSGGAKYYRYALGVHYEVCIGPVDSIQRIKYGEKVAWTGSVDQSQRITITQDNLYGGKKKEGGISGDFDLCFGEPDQAVNDYLASQLGTPLSAFRDSFCIVGRRPYLVANSTSIRAIIPRVTCIEAGWVGGETWYPERASIFRESINLKYDDKWKYRVVTAAQGGAPGVPSQYISPSYDDSGWDEGFGGFGSGGPGAGFGVGTFVPPGVGKGIWIRKHLITSHPGAVGDLHVDIYHDDGRWLWWNGELITLTQSQDYFHSTAVIPADKIKKTNVFSLQVLDSVPGGSSWNIYAGVALHSVNVKNADMNPAHIIMKAWTDVHQGMAYPQAMIDTAAMRAVADTLYEESFGLSLIWARSSPIAEFVEEICRHIGAIQTINPETGQLKIKLLRKDYTQANLPLLTEANVVEVAEWQDAADGSAVNTLTIKYLNREMDEAAITVTNRAAVAQYGVVADTREYRGIRTSGLAARVGDRDLRESTGKLARGKLVFDRSAWSLYPGDVFRFSHSPEGIAERVLRVLDIDQGTLTDGKITLDVVDDVWGAPPVAAAVEPEAGGQFPDPVEPPGEATLQRVIEAPYWQLLGDLGGYDAGGLPDAAGYVIGACATPDARVAEFDLWARVSPDAYAEVASDALAVPGGKLSAALPAQVTSTITLTDGADLEDVTIGMLALIDDELCLVTAVNGAGVAIDRGVLDTVPTHHASGAVVLFLSADPADWPRGASRYTDADGVEVKLLPGEEGSQPDIGTIAGMSCVMASRQFRPYPPGDVKIDGVRYPDSVTPSVSTQVSWTHRDRLGQGLMVVSAGDGGDYGPESGVTYTVEVRDVSSGSLEGSATGISGTSANINISAAVGAELFFVVYSIRDGTPSLQSHVIRSVNNNAQSPGFDVSWLGSDPYVAPSSPFDVSWIGSVSYTPPTP